MAKNTKTNPSSAENGILLEAGTNEVEILVFKVAGHFCGVNVAKVREVRNHESATHLPQSPDAVDGAVRVRDDVVPLINLQQILWGAEAETVAGEEQLLLEFNGQLIAFRVQGVDRIYRVSWKDFIPLPHCPGMEAPVTGVILIEGRIVTVLDFEAIGAVLGINGATQQVAGNGSEAITASIRPPVVFADDSPLIRRMLDDALAQAGYENRLGFSDGQEAWDYLGELAQSHSTTTIRKSVAGVISDIEMPRMDGFSLTRRIRENSVLKDLPVVLFSSLISKDNEKKGRQVGATAQISKPRWEELTDTLVNVLGEVVG